MKIGTRTHAILSMIPLVALVATVLAGCGRHDEAKSASVVSRVVKAKIRTIREVASNVTYEASGTIRSAFNSTLSSKVMGRVVSVAVHEGDTIKRGQLLVSLDPRELEAAVNIATANFHSSQAGVAKAATAEEMEERTSRARVVQAESQVSQAVASLAQAEARRDLAVAGPRTQELAQSHLAVVQAESSLRLATKELDRTANLVQEGALARRELDLAQNRYDVSKAQFDMAVESESIVHEGSRSQEIREAQDAVAQATGAVAQAKSGVVQAKAAEMQILVRRKEIVVAKAQVEQTTAAVHSAQTGLSYAQVLAPFDGRVVRRLVDPGSMASLGAPLLEVEGGDFRLEAMVPERVLKSVAIGLADAVKVDSIGSESFIGKVQEIVPQADKTSHAFLVKFVLPSTAAIKSGMFGRVIIPIHSAQRTFIPASATWQRDGLNYVFVVNKEGVARLRIVTLGDEVNDQFEVLSGLSTGERIVIGDRRAVYDGVRIDEN